VSILGPLYQRRLETEDATDAKLDAMEDMLRAVESELRITHERALRLEAAFIQLREDVEGTLRKLEAAR
jgi:hypothetical protein